MAKLKSELEVACPCCGALLVVDVNLGRVISHKEPEREDMPDLDAAQRILAEEKARREAVFLQSVEAEKTRGDALSKRFEEALRQARDEPVGPAAEAGVRSGLGTAGGVRRAASGGAAASALPRCHLSREALRQFRPVLAPRVVHRLLPGVRALERVVPRAPPVDPRGRTSGSGRCGIARAAGAPTFQTFRSDSRQS